MPAVSQPLNLPPDRGRHRRRIRYIDVSIQKWLLVGLVVIEIGFVVGMAWLMYRHLNQTIEYNLYRAHLAAAAPLLDQLLHAAWPLLGMYLVANALVLLLAHVIWRGYLNSLLSRFMALIDKTGRLDFSADAKASPDSHELLMLTGTQRTRERQRLAAIREQMMKLDSEVSASANPQRVRDALDSLEELLPP